MKPNSLQAAVMMGGLMWVLGAAAPGAMALDAVVIAHEAAPAAALSPAALKDMLTGKTMHWEGGQAVALVFVGDATDAALKEACGMDGGAFKTFWQRLVFSGRGQQPKKADTPEAAVALVSATKGALALVPKGTEPKGVKVLEVK